MSAVKIGIVLKVKDLPKCRSFYRDILELGNPVMDSNFLSVFAVGRDVNLSLEAVPPEEKLSKSEGRLFLNAAFGNPDEIISRLEMHGFPVRNRTRPASVPGVLEFHDPEGNPFHIQYY